MKKLIARATRSALMVLIELYTSQDFELSADDKKDLEKMREYHAMLDAIIQKEVQK